MYQLTHKNKYMLRVDLEDFTGRKGFALYSFFFLDCETDGYKLHVSGFTDGGAGRTLSFTLKQVNYTQMSKHAIDVIKDTLPLCRRLSGLP